MAIDIREMKKRLEEKRAELIEHLGGLDLAYPTPVNSDEASEGPQDFEEAAVDALEQEQEQAILVNERALLSEVDAALKRIEDGLYGKCVVDGVPIPEKRLEAIPWAARCVRHESELEQRNLSREELYDSETQ
ncbi:MAG TPA: TraR/DksA family transcriptional regulator [Ktedonobacteraceae bacterium]